MMLLQILPQTYTNFFHSKYIFHKKIEKVPSSKILESCCPLWNFPTEGSTLCVHWELSDLAFVRVCVRSEQKNTSLKVSLKVHICYLKNVDVGVSWLWKTILIDVYKFLLTEKRPCLCQAGVYRGGWLTLPPPVLLPVQEMFLLKWILLHQGTCPRNRSHSTGGDKVSQPPR